MNRQSSEVQRRGAPLGAPRHFSPGSRSGRVASAAPPPIGQARSAGPGGEVGPDHGPTSNRLACDLCGHARTRDERNRLVWKSDPVTELVLAELCSRCAARADSLVEFYGGRGCEAITLVREVRPSAPPWRVVGFIARGVVYLLIALTFFLIVTVFSSLTR